MCTHVLYMIDTLPTSRGCIRRPDYTHVHIHTTYMDTCINVSSSYLMSTWCVYRIHKCKYTQIHCTYIHTCINIYIQPFTIQQISYYATWNTNLYTINIHIHIHIRCTFHLNSSVPGVFVCDEVDLNIMWRGTGCDGKHYVYSIHTTHTHAHTHTHTHTHTHCKLHVQYIVFINNTPGKLTTEVSIIKYSFLSWLA